MPPTTQRRPQVTPAGVSARNSIAEVRQNVNNGATPAQARQTLTEIKTGSLRPTVPDVIPSTALAGNKTFEDVMDRRADLETEATAKNQLNQRFTDLTTRVNTNTPSTFANPDDMINRLLLNRAPSSTELQRNETATRNIENRRDFAGDIATARERANTEFGLPDLTAKLADTRTQYAEREQRLNNDIKRYEENALKRGVPREFVEAEKNKLKSDALEDLSNLAAIETAQAGSIQEARNIINDTINDKKAAFELENQAIEQEINYLNTLVGEENAQQAQQLQFALNERKTMQERELARETEIKEYMVEAASNGADQGTIQAIINAKSPEEAFRYAAPFVGLLDRRAKNASIRSANASAALNEAELIAFNKSQEDAATGVLTPEQAKIANELNKDFESQPIVKGYNEGLQKYIVLEDTLANGIDGIQDLQLVYDFMKAVDPTSVVRETEFDNAAKTGNIFQGAYARFNKTFGTGGFLPEEVKADFTRAARASFEARNSQYFNVKSEYANRINRTLGTTNGADYLTAYEGAAPLSEVDFDLVDSLSNASPEDLLDIMQRSQGLVGANLYQ